MNRKTEITGRPSAPVSATAWVHEELEPDQLSNAPRNFGLRVLSRRTKILLWGLRVYVVLMVLLTAVQIWNALHAAG